MALIIEQRENLSQNEEEPFFNTKQRVPFSFLAQCFEKLSFAGRVLITDTEEGL